MKQIHPFLLLVVATTSLSYGQSNDKLPDKEPNGVPSASLNEMVVNYGSAAWNKKSSEVDSAYVFVRDGISGRLAKIVLEETEPDSSVFKGKFSIRWEDLKSVKPEVYIPRLQTNGEIKNPAEFNKLISSQDVSKKPFIFKKQESGKQTLEVYDTREQAANALKIYKQKLEADKKSKVVTKPLLDKTEEEFAREARRKAELLALEVAAAERASDRLRQEQLERQKILERQQEQDRLNKEEKQRRRDRAIEVAKSALALYQKGDYRGAEEKFQAATELDPDNQNYYFQYGVTLYRNEKFNEAVVKLNIAKVGKAQELEKQYYIGLIHYRLQELEPALDIFSKIETAQNPVLSPSAGFYKGIILFGKEEFAEAQKSFEKVLDDSQDPSLDQNAEDYIEKCIRMIAFKKDQAKRHLVSVNAGVTYDSNVLFQPDNQSTSSALDKASVRYLGGYSYEYRAIRGEKNSLNIKTTGSAMYSVSEDLSIADPYVFNLTVPYSRTGTWGKKSVKFSVEPGYEVLNMNLDGVGATEQILGSLLLNTSFLIVNSQSWLSIYNLDIRSDDSLTSVTDADDDSDSMKYNLKTSQMFFFDKLMKKAVIFSAGITYNDAIGRNKDYGKIDVAATYTAPFSVWLSSWNAGLAVYQQDYSNATSLRSDQDYSITGGLIKTWTEAFSTSLSALYNLNESNDASNQYNKYSVTLSTTYSF